MKFGRAPTTQPNVIFDKVRSPCHKVGSANLLSIVVLPQVSHLASGVGPCCLSHMASMFNSETTDLPLTSEYVVGVPFELLA